MPESGRSLRPPAPNGRHSDAALRAQRARRLMLNYVSVRARRRDRANEDGSERALRRRRAGCFVAHRPASSLMKYAALGSTRSVTIYGQHAAPAAPAAHSAQALRPRFRFLIVRRYLLPVGLRAPIAVRCAPPRVCRGVLKFVVESINSHTLTILKQNYKSYGNEDCDAPRSRAGDTSTYTRDTLRARRLERLLALSRGARVGRGPSLSVSAGRQRRAGTKSKSPVRLLSLRKHNTDQNLGPITSKASRGVDLFPRTIEKLL
ncbi:hypothetical protein EVAR_78412_1 [Eumeta japonica]|uniref:Uncharacterized protein n=1 Tax=Eumeta variegata TaxID=151549 RepID=A0A4C1T4H8_EUMVA|nr:hypothetical protein EVAR_78412_1 [Eumeta japonica]